MQHHHRQITSTSGHALGTCRRVELIWCECGAFRLNGSERWVEPKSLPDGNELTSAEPARYLAVSVNTLYRLARRKQNDGRKVESGDHPYHALRWTFSRQGS